MGLKAQFKIMQMIFMVLGLFLFFILVGIFLINSQMDGLKQSSEDLKRSQTLASIETIVNSPEFSCGGTTTWCVDKDKMSIMSGDLGKKYYDFWQISSIEVQLIYPNDEPEIIECPSENCNYYNIYEINQTNKKTYSSYITLCEQQGRSSTNCQLAKFIVGVKNA